MQDEIIVDAFGEVETDLVEAVSLAVKERFGVRSASGQRFLVPAQSYSRERDQYRSTEFLNVLARHEGTRIKLGITNVDLFVPELNFVFGEASETLRAAVFSTARLDPRAYGEPENEALSMRRATTEAVHELGHVFGPGPLQTAKLRQVVFKYALRNRSQRKRISATNVPRCWVRVLTGHCVDKGGNGK